MNYTFNASEVVWDPNAVNTVTTQHRVISLPGIIFITALFVFLAYWYVKVTKNKEQYQNWTNPNGRIVNLYRVIRILFWGYVGVIIVFGLIAILTAPK